MAEPYLVVDADGTPMDRVLWDGESQFSVPRGHVLVRESLWKGPGFGGPPESREERRRRRRVERATASLDDVRADREMVGGIVDKIKVMDDTTPVGDLARQVLRLARVVTRGARADKRALALLLDVEDDENDGDGGGDG